MVAVLLLILTTPFKDKPNIRIQVNYHQLTTRNLKLRIVMMDMRFIAGSLSFRRLLMKLLTILSLRITFRVMDNAGLIAKKF